MSLTVAIIGRPNVGKSTLFNRLVGKRLALVDDTPGVTRDRREGEARLGDLCFRVVDTAGFEDARGQHLATRIQAQTARALELADIALFVIDAREGLTPLDRELAGLLRRADRPMVLVANKCEGRAGEAGLADAFALGLGEPLPLSAEHGEGMALLYDVLRPFVDAADEASEADAPVSAPVSAPEEPKMPDTETVDTETTAPEARKRAASGDAPGASERDAHRTLMPLQLAVIGRPNVGKSTLINRLIGDERLITGPEAGITRDAIAVDWQFRGRTLRLFDTAGLRKRARVDDRLERLAGADTLRSVRFAHVAVIVIDATAGLEKQDLTIADLVATEGRAPLLVANKWDLVADRKAAMDAILGRLEQSLPQLRGLRVVPLSALSGDGLSHLLPAVLEVHGLWNRQLPTPKLNRWLAEMTARQAPPSVQGRPLKLRYMAQIKSRPPTFVVFANRPQEVPEAYLRYLANGLRESFGLIGIPLRFTLRRSKNPYAR